MTQIDLVPFGGLGNRLRVFNSGLHIAVEIGVEINLVWIVKAELNVDFAELFCDAGIPFERVSRLKQRIFNRLLKHIYIQKHTWIYRFVLSYFYDLVLFDEEILTWPKEKLMRKVAKSSRVLIATCYQFWSFEDYNNFKLQPKIENQLLDITNELGSFKDVVGVHIRRTDHVDIIKSSSLEDYFSKMYSELENNKDTKFFLCSDDKTVKDELKQKFGEKIITNNIELSRASESGMKGAILDIYLLANTEKIIANSKSSFAVLASMIGMKKKIIEV